MGEGATRLVLVRHGEAICNVEGVIGGLKGCTGLTAVGVAQATGLAARLARTGELDEVAALYASALPRAVETAQILASALGGPGGAVPEVVADCALCELHPGDADALTWAEYVARFERPDWDADPSTPLAPGGEGWSGFVERAASALERVAAAHDGQTVVVVTHAGVVEASMLRFLPIDRSVARLGLHTLHASLTEWLHLFARDGADAGADGRGGGGGGADVRGSERQRRWRLERYNDTATP